MLSILDKVYWMRVSLGVVAGTVANFLFHADYLDGILIGILFYLASYYIGRYLWFKSITPENLTKLYTQGLGSYIMLFLFTWLLLFTLTI